MTSQGNAPAKAQGKSEIKISNSRTGDEKYRYRGHAIRAAKLFIDEDSVLVKVATTGLGATDRIIEIACIDTQGSMLLESLVNPGRKIPDSAVRVHGIDNDMVVDAPTLDEIWTKLAEIMASHQRLLAYPASYERKMIAMSTRQRRPEMREWQWRCMTQLYAPCAPGERTNVHGDPEWQTLQQALDQCGVPRPEPYRRAGNTVQAMLEMLRHIASMRAAKQKVSAGV